MKTRILTALLLVGANSLHAAGKPVIPLLDMTRLEIQSSEDAACSEVRRIIT